MPTAGDERFLRSFALGWRGRGLPVSPTLGVEHECFLRRRDGGTVGHADGQRLFATLVGIGWRPEHERDDVLGPLDTGVSASHALGLMVIKLEHHPHLIELATPPCPSLDALMDVLRTMWRVVESAGDACGLEIAHQPFADVTADDPAVWSEHHLCRRLRAYRHRVAEAGGYALPRRILNFSAEIAGTQLHFGGVGFQSLPAVMPGLYAEEAALAVAAVGPTNLHVLARRWSLYRDSLPGLPLVGFPDLPAWTLEDWAHAAGRMPLMSGNEPQPRVVRMADAVEAGDLIEHPPLLAQLRDLQLLRPRIFGTIECRADPAQPSLAAIEAQAARRIAAYRRAREATVGDAAAFCESRSRWWAVVGLG